MFILIPLCGIIWSRIKAAIGLTHQGFFLYKYIPPSENIFMFVLIGYVLYASLDLTQVGPQASTSTGKPGLAVKINCR